jgi:hypothetical protein
MAGLTAEWVTANNRRRPNLLYAPVDESDQDQIAMKALDTIKCLRSSGLPASEVLWQLCAYQKKSPDTCRAFSEPVRSRLVRFADLGGLHAGFGF